MGFFDKKCAMLIMKRKKRKLIELLNQEGISALGEKKKKLQTF